MSTLIERHIVSLLAEKDDKAISLLYENYGDTLFGVAFKVVKDEDLAQDVLQESFIKIWKKADTYDASKAKQLWELSESLGGVEFKLTDNKTVASSEVADAKDEGTSSS